MSGETRYTQPNLILDREGVIVAVKDFTLCPPCHRKGFRDDGTICDLCHGAGEIEVHNTPDNQEEEEKQ